MPDLDLLHLLPIVFVFVTSIATALLAWYKKQERDERRKGRRYSDITPTGFNLLEKTFQAIDLRYDRILDFDEALNDIAESSESSDQEKTDEKLRAQSAVETLVRTDCLRKRDGDGNIYEMTERGLQVREYHHQNRWWKIWMRSPL